MATSTPSPDHSNAQGATTWPIANAGASVTDGTGPLRCVRSSPHLLGRGQLRRVPSASEGLDQRHARDHAPREKIDCRPLIL